MSDGREPGPGLRERKKARTRATLRATALRLFSQRGYDAVTIDDIVDVAEVSRSTFFRYFASKDDVLLGDDPSNLEVLRLEVLARPPDEPVLASLRAGVLTLAGRYEMDRDQLLATHRIMRNTPSLVGRRHEQLAAWEGAYASIVHQRLPHGDDRALRARVIAAAVLAAVRVAVDEWTDGDGRGDLGGLIAQAFEVVLPITGPSGGPGALAHQPPPQYDEGHSGVPRGGTGRDKPPPTDG